MALQDLHCEARGGQKVGHVELEQRAASDRAQKSKRNQSDPILQEHD